MKRPYPDKEMFHRSSSRIPSTKALNDYEYALWEAGFECAVRKMLKTSKIITECIEGNHSFRLLSIKECKETRIPHRGIAKWRCEKCLKIVESM